MKQKLKSILLKFGIQINFTKNLWYKNSFLVLQKLVKEQNPVIFDIGAADGSSVEEFKNYFPNSIIYSFEPYPTAFNNLKIISTKYENVYVFPLALSDNNDAAFLYINKSKATNSLFKSKITNSFIDEHAVPEGQIEIQQNTIDDFLKEQNISGIDILKMDVQGGELKVLKGAENLLLQQKVKYIYSEIWFIEGYDGQPLYHDIAMYVSTFGYKPFGTYNVHYRQDGHFLWGDALFYLP